MFTGKTYTHVVCLTIIYYYQHYYYHCLAFQITLNQFYRDFDITQFYCRICLTHCVHTIEGQVAIFYCLKLSAGYLVTTCIYSPNKYLINLITCNRGFIFNVSLRLIYYFLDNVVIRILDGEVHHSTSASQNLQNTSEVFVLKKTMLHLKKRTSFGVVICTSWRSTVKCSRYMAEKISLTPFDFVTVAKMILINSIYRQLQSRS